jgi:hypothetical protein
MWEVMREHDEYLDEESKTVSARQAQAYEVPGMSLRYAVIQGLPRGFSRRSCRVCSFCRG